MVELDKTLNIISILRKNCPSDIARTNFNVIDCLKEELDEVKKALDNSDIENLTEELGDLLFNVLFLINIEKDLKRIKIEEILDKVNNKMIFRHPHVFDERKKVTKEEADLIWKEQKKKEKELGIK